MARFSITPLAAPCCPLPTPDKALAAAQQVPGVLAAELLDDSAVRVRFDPAQTDTETIASAINQASFMVSLAASDTTTNGNVIAEKE